MWSLFNRPPIAQVRVHTPANDELEFQITNNTTGQQLFDQVAKTIGLRETWFFGLQYRDAKGFDAWLDMHNKVMNHDLPKLTKQPNTEDQQQASCLFELRVMYYPEDVSQEVFHDITLRFIYYQIRDAILNDQIYCAPESAVLLASYALQAQFGDHSSEINLQDDRVLPVRVIEQHDLTADQWRDRIGEWWADHAGMLPEDAMMGYLKLAQDLEMYGVNYFEASNKKGTKVWLGIDAHGLSVYKHANKLTPKTGFPWSEMRSAEYTKKQFSIIPTDKKAPAFVCTVARYRMAKQMLTLARGNWNHYMRRRNSDSIEVQQMKAKMAEEKAAKQRERDQLVRQIEARRAAEKAMRECEQRLQAMVEQMQIGSNGLADAYDKIGALERQLRDVQLSRDNLEQQQLELKELLGQLENAKELETSVRAKLEEEVRVRQADYDRAQAELSAKDKEAKLLAAEMDELKRRHVETSVVQREVAKCGCSTSLNTTIEEDEVTLQVDLTTGHGGVSGDSSMPRSEEVRQTVVSKKRDLQQQLKDLCVDLAKVVIHSKVTSIDEQHRENVQLGRDKYKTLREIRKGNTMRRVEYFESM